MCFKYVLKVYCADCDVYHMLCMPLKKSLSPLDETYIGLSYILLCTVIAAIYLRITLLTSNVC